MEEFKQMQRGMWEAGDYVTLSDYVEDIGERLVERVGIEPEMQVLDVACGTGSTAIPAAKAGAAATGLDLAPKLLEGGRRKAAALGVEVEWVEGDAEDLPFEDDRFDRVLSTIGHMFAPRHRKTADEMTRVCRQDGVIGFCNWTPEGTVGDVFKVTGSHMPAPPDFAEPPILWGTEDHVREMFPTAEAFEFERHENRVEWESAAGFLDFFAERFGPLVTAKQMLGDEFEQLRGEILEIFEARNVAEDGGFVLPQEYLLAIVRL
jgi:SAM-dependent methyltransferase